MGGGSVKAGGQGRGLSRVGCGRVANVLGGDGRDFDVNRGRTGERDGVDGSVKILEVLTFSGGGIWADFAGEVPIIAVGGHGFGAFAFHVFAHVVLDGFDNSGRRVAGCSKQKGLFPGQSVTQSKGTRLAETNVVGNFWGDGPFWPLSPRAKTEA